MKFDDIFARRVDRPLDGVIKPDKNDNLASELEEYVLTPEIRRSLQRFCDEYNDPHSDGNGAWISGFYGSGKSHLLKILSYLVENRMVAGEDGVERPALDYLKPKLADDPMLLAALEKACERTPSKSVLFSIGAKADTGNTRDALLSAFIKVLNEASGYFDGTKAYIASFERELDGNGLYERFIEEFERETGKDWKTARRKRATTMASDISRVYDRVTGQPQGTHTDVLEQFARDYHPSHEDFADWCAEYIERQGPGFRLNFFVDEVGQFIGANDDLLFSLQNVAELLNSRCHGRAWVIVVSQENVEDIIGDFKSTGSSKDFTKIQARFKVKIKIPSNDANTVVRDRLLEKAPSALGGIDKLYERYHGDFKVLFDFPNGAKHYALYEDEDDFEAYYPMVPYQFPLFHKALTGLSDHNAFTGEYTSTGARNMLGATRNVLLSTKDKSVDEGDLVPFDLMFEGLYTELKSEAFEAISTAQDHFGYDDGGLGLRILKVLLLVKYNDEFQATPANLRVLLYSSFSEDAVALEERIAETLRQLEAENYVRRNGEAFEYLTDEEKDIEAEIKREVVTDADIRAQIGKLFREDVVNQTRVQYMNGDFTNPYPYDVQVDGTAVGMGANALKLNILTDLTDDPRGRYVMVAGTKELVCALPANSELIHEVRLWLQTNKYVSRNMHGDDLRARILQEKHGANGKRHNELKAALRDLVAEARWATCNVDVTADVKGQGASEHVDSAVRIMISKSYPLLSILRERYDSTSIYKCATENKLMAGESLPPYAQEVLDEVGRTLTQADRCCVGGGGSNSLETRLGGGQHGWPAAPVRQAVALLACNGFLECFRSDAPLEGAALGRDLSQGRSLGDVNVIVVKTVSAETIEALQRAHKAITGVTTADSDHRAVADAILTDLKDKRDSYSGIASRAHAYPFSGRYEEELGVLRVAADRSRDWVVEHIGEAQEGIVAAVEELHDMAEFVNGQQGKRYDEAAEFLRTQEANIASCREAAGAAAAMRAVLADAECWRNGSIPQLKRLQREAADAIDAELKEAKAEAASELEAFAQNFRQQDCYTSAVEGIRAHVEANLAECSDQISAGTQIAIVRRLVDRFKAEKTSLLYEILTPTPVPPEPEPDDGNSNDEDDTTSEPNNPPVKTVMYKYICVPAAFKGHVLVSEEDVAQFVDALAEQLNEQVRNNSRIVL